MVVPSPLSVSFHVVGHFPAYGFITLGFSFSLSLVQSVMVAAVHYGSHQPHGGQRVIASHGKNRASLGCLLQRQ